MIALYHNALSTCSQKVRLVLAEKQLDFDSHEVDLIAGGQHDPEYVKLNPKHVVPTLVHDGRVLVESSLIIRYLDEAFPTPPMRPEHAPGRYALDAWLHHADQELHPAAPTVTFAMGPRQVLLQQPEAVREANLASIPDPAARARRRSVIEHGVKAPEFGAALGVFVKTLDRMEGDLADSAWLSGEGFGLADATLLPYVLRVHHLGMEPLLAPDARPRVADWFDRVRARPAFETAVEGWLAAPVVDLMRKGGEALWAEIEPIARSV